MPVGPGQDRLNGDTVAVDEHRPLQAQFAAVDRQRPGTLTDAEAVVMQPSTAIVRSRIVVAEQVVSAMLWSEQEPT